MDCPDLNSMSILEAIPLLAAWIQPYLPPKIIHANEKISDAELIALAILRHVRKVPYFSRWWQFLTTDLKLELPSIPQASIRLKRLTPVVEQLSHKVEELDFAVIDSTPIPVCRYKRAEQCKFPDADFGHGTQGKIYGFKLHAWTLLNGKIANYVLLPARQHDFPAGCSMNHEWPDYGAPQIIGDKGYYGGGYIVPPKSNTKKPDPRWRDEFYAARKIIESTFSSLVGRGLRWGQVKTWSSLRLKVACIIAAFNLRFLDLSQFHSQVNP